VVVSYARNTGGTVDRVDLSQEPVQQNQFQLRGS